MSQRARRHTKEMRHGSRDLVWGITVLRVTLGIIFTIHGAHQLFVLGPAGTGSIMAAASIPAPVIVGLGVSVLELAGGICLLLGFLVRPVAVLLAVEMAVAAITIHLPQGFFAAVGGAGGYEYPLVLAGASASLALTAASRPR